jgi:hypothetical protein
VAGLSGLIGRARGGSGGMASYCMVSVAVAGGSGGLAWDGLCGGAGLAWLSARLPGGLGEASCCIVANISDNNYKMYPSYVSSLFSMELVATC